MRFHAALMVFLFVGAQSVAADADTVPDALREAAATLIRAADLLEADTRSTDAEWNDLSLAVSGCWVVEEGSEAAMVAITVGFELDRQGRVVGNDVRLVNSSGGSAGATDSAFQSARRAILRCQSTTGYMLPADKYEQWREVEMTFDPSGMRMR